MNCLNDGILSVMQQVRGVTLHSLMELKNQVHLSISPEERRSHHWCYMMEQIRPEFIYSICQLIDRLLQKFVDPKKIDQHDVEIKQKHKKY